jgi:hypothetical protein
VFAVIQAMGAGGKISPKVEEVTKILDFHFPYTLSEPGKSRTDMISLEFLFLVLA